MDIVKTLGQARFFEGISVNNLQRLANMSQSTILKKKQILFTEGESGHSLFFLLVGKVQLHKTSPDGKEIVVRVIKPGEVFAEVILFEENHYPVTAIAITDCEILELSKEKLHSLLDQTDFRNDFIRMLLKKQRFLAKQIQLLSTPDIKQRFFSFLKDQYGEKEMIESVFSKKDTAFAIGTTPETLSRLLLTLRNDRTLFWEKKQIRFKQGFWIDNKKQGL